MDLNLVRHARAISRGEWDGDDLLRPLSDAGRREAKALASYFRDTPIARIIAGPNLRCQQTVEPLAVAKELPIEVDERLGRSEEVARVLELMPAPDDGPTIFCTHSETITSVVEALELFDPERGAELSCKKGSIWRLEGRGYGPSRATYIEPVRHSKRRKIRYTERESSRPRSLRAGVLDLGSTSFTLLIADVRRDGTIRPVVSEKVMLRLGAALADGDRIPKNAFAEAVEVARDLHAVAEQEKVEWFQPVATAAMRDASNGRKLARAISEAIGLPVRILSGEEEARVMFRAFQQRLDLGNDPALGIDLGGGSLELAIGCAQSIRTEATLPLGVVRTRQSLVEGDPMSSADIRRIRKLVRCELAPLRDELLRFAPRQVVAAGGTVRALARLVAERTRPLRDRESVVLPHDTLRQLAKELSRSTHDERLRMRGIRRRRADLLPTGAVILETLAEELQIDSITVCGWGLREGVLLEA